MKTTQGVVSVIPLGGSTGQMAILVDGIVTYVGSPEECQRRLDILQRKTPDPSAATVGLVGLSVSPNNFERLC